MIRILRQGVKGTCRLLAAQRTVTVRSYSAATDGELFEQYGICN